MKPLSLLRLGNWPRGEEGVKLAKREGGFRAGLRDGGKRKFGGEEEGKEVI